MFEITIKILIAFFCSLGVIYLFNFIIDYYLLRKNAPIKDISVVVITKGHCNEAEYVIRSLVYATSKIKTESGVPQVIIVDDYMDGETASICSYLEDDFDMVKIYSKKQALKLITEKYIGETEK